MAKKKERRNSTPEKVQVKNISDFSDIQSFNEKVDALVENRNEVVIHNVEHILRQRNISQAYMCDRDLNGQPSSPQLTSYKKKGKDIPFRMVARIAMMYGYTPEQMYSQLLDQANTPTPAANTPRLRPAQEYAKYVGTYSIAYFASDPKLGTNHRTTAQSLCFGVLSVFSGVAEGGAPSLNVLAFLNCTAEERELLLELARNAEQPNSNSSLRSCYENMCHGSRASRLKCLYEGELLLVDRIAEITLRQIKGSDIVHIRLHNSAAISSEGSSYSGGLTTMMCTSRGTEHMPCVQAAILSKRGFANTASEELAEYLFMDTPNIDFEYELDEIVTCIKKLYPGDDPENPTTQFRDADKTFLLKGFIEKRLIDILNRNVFSYYKVTSDRDCEAYKALCREPARR